MSGFIRRLLERAAEDWAPFDVGCSVDSIAYHEAGHVVAGLAAGVRIDGAALTPDSQIQQGLVYLPSIHNESPGLITEADKDCPTMRQAALGLAMFYQGGLVAEIIHAGIPFDPLRRYVSPTARQDHRNARHVLELVYDGAELLLFGQYMVWCTLWNNWAAVRRLAEVLERDGRIGREIIAALPVGMAEPFEPSTLLDVPAVSRLSFRA